MPRSRAEPAREYFKDPWSIDELRLFTLGKLGNATQVVPKEKIYSEVMIAAKQYYTEEQDKAEKGLNWRTRASRNIRGQYHADIERRLSEFQNWYDKNVWEK